MGNDHARPDLDRADRKHRTMLYIPMGIAAELKVIAARRGCSVNTLLVEASEALVLAYRTGATREDDDPPMAGVAAGLALRRDLDALAERLAVLEARVDGRTSVAAPGGERQILDTAGVRREARALIAAQGAPVPHRILLGLLQERFVLPGKNPSENLRTVLVHPKSRGFRFVRGKGYDLAATDEGGA